MNDQEILDCLHRAQGDTADRDELARDVRALYRVIQDMNRDASIVRDDLSALKRKYELSCRMGDSFNKENQGLALQNRELRKALEKATGTILGTLPIDKRVSAGAEGKKALALTPTQADAIVSAMESYMLTLEAFANGTEDKEPSWRKVCMARHALDAARKGGA